MDLCIVCVFSIYIKVYLDCNVEDALSSFNCNNLPLGLHLIHICRNYLKRTLIYSKTNLSVIAFSKSMKVLLLYSVTRLLYY